MMDVEVLLLLLVLVTTIIGLIKAIYEARAARKAARHATRQVYEIHRIVNSQHDSLVAWATLMANRLREHDIDVPPLPPDVDFRQRG